MDPLEAAALKEDVARMAELRLCIAANQAARAHSRNAIVQRHCTQRIESAEDELRTLELLAKLAQEETP